MTPWQRYQIDSQLKSSLRLTFQDPSTCDDLEQIRKYVSQLCVIKESYQVRFGYVPSLIYTLIAKYNRRQNEIIGFVFRDTYCLP
jgi:hypothetical protein